MLEELKLELEFIGPVELIALDVLLIAEDDEVSILELLETEEELSSLEMAELTALLISLLDDDESTELTSLLTLLTTLLLALLILLELLLLFELPPHAVSVSATPIHVTKGNNFIWTSLYYFYAYSSVVKPTLFHSHRSAAENATQLIFTFAAGRVTPPRQVKRTFYSSNENEIVHQ